MLDNSAMKTKVSITLLVAVLSLLLTSACGNDLNTAQGVAEEFVDHHYVKIDLQKAKQYTVSVAQAKIDEEIRLTKGQAIDASTQKPRVNYTLLEKTEGDQRSTFLFEGKIQSDDGTSFIRKWSIATRKEGTGWRVSNFTESD
jgi:predicted small secreted protein